MSYSASASPQTKGYKESAYPESSYSPSADDKAGTFIELSPYKNYKETVEGGVGRFHFNHFIGYFKSPKKKFLTEDFLARFPLIFNHSENVAWVNVMDGYKFNGKSAVKFLHSNPLKAYSHEDWVSLQMAADKQSFFARTLQREWVYKKEVIASALAKPLNLNIDLPLDANRRHFLAGRRSWAVGYLPESKLYYVETAAFERYSHPFYDYYSNALSIGAPVIAEIWSKLIKDYIDYYEMELVPNDELMHTFSNYTKDFIQGDGIVIKELRIIKNVYYAQEDRPTAAEAHAVPWFKEVLKRHPGLLS